MTEKNLVDESDLIELTQHFDHTSSTHAANVLDRYRTMQTHCPVAKSDQHGGFWVVSKYDTIVKMLRQPDLFASGEGVVIPPLPFPVKAIPTESDRPAHADYRAVFLPFLTPGVVSRYESVISRRTNELIDSFAARGKADFLADFANRLPAQVVADFFGFGPADGERCYGWVKDSLNPPGGDPALALQAVQKLGQFIAIEVEHARANPGDDLISAIATHVTSGGAAFSDEECLGLLITAIVGALETTVSALASTVMLLDRFPDRRAELLDNPVLIPNAVDEVLRMESPVHGPKRTVTRDIEIDGHHLCAGEQVLLMYGSGNYDSDKFSEPEQFNLHRKNNPHLAFGHGIHRCVGAPLALLELRIALTEILRRIPDFRVTNIEGPSVHAGGTWGLTKLDIEFTPELAAS